MKRKTLSLLFLACLALAGSLRAQSGSTVAIGSNNETRRVEVVSIWYYVAGTTGDVPAFPGWHQFTGGATSTTAQLPYVANGAVTKVASSTAGTATLPYRATRRAVLCMNRTATSETVYYGFATGVNATTGAQILPNSGVSLQTTAVIYFYSASGASVVECTESYD